ncbi:MAG: hypothetical protein OEM82_14345, partial [Acidobacteriota bacterium]|nr:hypothetical protein [Acidobacteriota bacterium]
RFFLIALILVVGMNGCGGSDPDDPGILSLSSDRDKAIELVEDANEDLKRIRVLYRENNSKVNDLKTALSANEIGKVKKMSDDLLLVILDGYALAESAQEKISKAQRLDIHTDFKYYLSLKEEGLAMQIKAFDYRRDSAKLFRDKFGSDDKTAMAEAAKKFKENEANFEKTMAEATKISLQADQLYKEVNNRKK